MPRRRSSAHRSGSIPVSARTSVDLPWSTWPAVATTCMPARPRPGPGPPSGAVRAGRAGSGPARADRAPLASRPAVARRTARAGPPRRWAARPRARRHPRRWPRTRRRRRRSRPRRAARPAAGPGCGRSAGSASSASAVGVAGPRRVASNAARVSLSTRIARASGWRRRRCTSSAPAPGAPSSSPACGPPSSLSPDAVTSVAPCPSAVAASGSSGSSGCGASRPEPMSATTGTPRSVSSSMGTELVKPVTTKFDGCTLRTIAVSSAHRRGVVLAPDPVRGAHLAQPGPGRGEQLGDPEAVADLDELAAGDDDLAPSPCEGRRHQRERRGAVVDQVRGAGPGDGGQQRVDRGPPAGTAVAGGEVELDVAGPGGQLDRGAGSRGEGRAAEVGVQQDAGGVEDRPQRGGRGGQRVKDGVDHRLRRELPGAHALLRGRDRGLDERAAQVLGGLGDARLGEHRVRPRHTPPRIKHVGTILLSAGLPNSSMAPTCGGSGSARVPGRPREPGLDVGGPGILRARLARPVPLVDRRPPRSRTSSCTARS